MERAIPWIAGRRSESQTASHHQRPPSTAGAVGRLPLPASAGDDVRRSGNRQAAGSPLDSVLMLMDASGKLVAFNDDYGDNRDAGLGNSPRRLLYPRPHFHRRHILSPPWRHPAARRTRIRLPPPRQCSRPTSGCGSPPRYQSLPRQNVAVAVFALRKDGFAGDIGPVHQRCPGRAETSAAGGSWHAG